MAAVAFGLITVGLLCFGSASSAGLWLLIPFLLFFGIGYGGSTGTRPSMVTEYFGKAKSGTLFGLIVGIIALGSIFGPFIAGCVYDTCSSDQGVWLGYTGLAIAAILLIINVSKMKLKSGSEI